MQRVSTEFDELEEEKKLLVLPCQNIARNLVHIEGNTLDAAINALLASFKRVHSILRTQFKITVEPDKSLLQKQISIIADCIYEIAHERIAEKKSYNSGVLINRLDEFQKISLLIKSSFKESPSSV